MKKTIGLAALMLTAVAAFAQPAAAYENARYNGCNDGRKEVVVVQRDNRLRDRREVHDVRNVRPVHIRNRVHDQRDRNDAKPSLLDHAPMVSEGEATRKDLTHELQINDLQIFRFLESRRMIRRMLQSFQFSKFSARFRRRAANCVKKLRRGNMSRTRTGD